jgi:hypothetical protein
MTYYGVRLKANGEPSRNDGVSLVLTRFVTEDGRTWEISGDTINNCTVHWRLPNE